MSGLQSNFLKLGKMAGVGQGLCKNQMLMGEEERERAEIETWVYSSCLTLPCQVAVVIAKSKKSTDADFKTKFY